jgi:hypothetical protein
LNHRGKAEITEEDHGLKAAELAASFREPASTSEVTEGGIGLKAEGVGHLHLEPAHFSVSSAFPLWFHPDAEV